MRRFIKGSGGVRKTRANGSVRLGTGRGKTVPKTKLGQTEKYMCICAWRRVGLGLFSFTLLCV